MKILFVTPGLGVGGAEIMLLNLAGALVQRGNIVAVVSLTPNGGVAERLRDVGVQVFEPAGRRAGFGFLMRSIGFVKQFKPDFIQGWMYIGCILASFFGITSGCPVAWSLHHSNFSRDYNSGFTLFTIRVCAFISKWRAPSDIFYCGPNSRDAHHKFGFSKTPSSILPNAVDFNKFKPDHDARFHSRTIMRLDSSVFMVGIFANRVPIKDHPTFFKAMALFISDNPNIRFLCCGTRMDESALDLAEPEDRPILAQSGFFLGRRHDVAALMNSCDVVVLTSEGESFPLALTEAAACGIPVVSTDVGDCPWIVGDRSFVFSPGDALGLTGILSRILAMDGSERLRLGRDNLNRIKLLFDLDVVVDCYLALVARIINPPTRAK